MGRRALRKLDPAIDLSRFLVGVESLDPPFDPASLFSRTPAEDATADGALTALHSPALQRSAPRPLEIEIGSGKGLFMVSASGERPEHDFLGVEIAAKYARHAAARLARAGRTNAVMLHGDARRLVQILLPDGCTAAVHVYFPDPWWKKRHLKRRLMNELFVQQIERVLSPGGALHFWTDVEEYYLAVCEMIPVATRLSGPHIPAPLPARHDLDYRTHFERRMRKHDEAIYRAEFCKAEGNGSPMPGLQ